jgi:6-pyruvoyltetrahydropterin/6-carboxytetrahydropterin synthase
MVYLTRREHFNAAHRLYVTEWSEARNREVFGPCCRPNYHGHNFNLWVTVKGEPDPDTGFIINAKELSRIMKERVVRYLDHKNLNLDVEEFRSMQPSTENVVRVIWKRLESHLPPGILHRVKLEETENIYAEYYGE